MGIFDFLFDDRSSEERKVSGHEDTLTNMYVQPPDREFAIEQLRSIGTERAIEALLSRFEEQAPNTTVDIDEKEQVYETLVKMGRNSNAPVSEALKAYLVEKEEKINWPLRALDKLSSEHEMCNLITDLLQEAETGYQRNPEKKKELIIRAADFQDRELAETLLRFLDDENEMIRFQTVEALLAQNEEDLLEEPFIEHFTQENSLRILKKLAQTFLGHKEWKIPEDEREAIDQALPDEYGVHDRGHIYEK